MFAGTELDALLLERLKSRNRKEQDNFACIVNSNGRLLNSLLILKKQNRDLNDNDSRLRKQIQDLQQRKDSVSSEEQQQRRHEDDAEKLKLQAELTSLLRERGENKQQIIDLNNKVVDIEKELSAKEVRCMQKDEEIEALKHQNNILAGQADELTATNQMLKDEQQALQLAFVKLEEKFRTNQDEYNDLVKRWLDTKATEADQANAELRDFNLAKQRKLEKDITAAIKTEVQVPHMNTPICVGISLPTKVQYTFDAHDGEVNAIKWSPSGRMFATAGNDRKVKLWTISDHRAENKGQLTGSNAGIMSIDFDTEDGLLLGASNDFASRVWETDSLRQRHTLTGHANKVLTAKFLGDHSKVVSGSHDRTLKMWDLRERACIKTLFAGSSCNDLVSTLGNHIISGHFDRKLRFWDARSESSTNEITLQGRITSLDVSPDRGKLLALTRENSLKLIDMRMNQVTQTFQAANFHVGTDYTKAVFSPDGEYLCAGSSDGTVFIWNINKNKVETTLKEHNHAVNACSWHPTGNMLVTCDRNKKVVVWSDF